MQQLPHDGTDTSSDTDYFIQFVTKSSYHHPVLNHVIPQGDSSLFLAQLKEPDIQRTTNTIGDGELPPNHVDFESFFFQKLINNTNQLEVNRNVLYRNYFQHKGKATSQQIFVLDNIVYEIIRKLHDNLMQGHSGSIKMSKKLRKRSCTPK